MRISHIEQWKTMAEAEPSQMSFNLTVCFGIAYGVCKILEYRRNRLKPPREPCGMIVQGENLLLRNQNTGERRCFFNCFRTAFLNRTRLSSRRIASILRFSFGKCQPQWIDDKHLNLIRHIAKMLDRFFMEGRCKQMKFYRAPIGVQLGKGRQRLGGKNASPQQARRLACAMKWIVTLKEALWHWLIGNPMKLFPFTRAPEGFHAQRLWNLRERRNLFERNSR